MLVSKDLASSGNIRSVWNHHIDYFGACCWNIFSREIRHPFLRKPTSEQVSVFYCLHGSFSADHDITFNLFVMRTKEIHHSIPTKKYQPPANDNQLFESKNQAKKRNFQPFSYHFFSQPKTSSQPVPFPSRFPHWIHHGVHGWHGGLARTPGGGSEFVTKKPWVAWSYN